MPRSSPNVSSALVRCLPPRHNLSPRHKFWNQVHFVDKVDKVVLLVLVDAFDAVTGHTQRSGETDALNALLYGGVTNLIEKLHRDKCGDGAAERMAAEDDTVVGVVGIQQMLPKQFERDDLRAHPEARVHESDAGNGGPGLEVLEPVAIHVGAADRAVEGRSGFGEQENTVVNGEVAAAEALQAASSLL